MEYISTRGAARAKSGAEAILQGIAADGGLYVPRDIPVLQPGEWAAIDGADYRRTAVTVLERFLGELDGAALRSAVAEAYGTAEFPDGPAPLAELGDNLFALELWHGPTAAFKDMALQLLPRLLTLCRAETGERREALVLAATSGDTGKAAMEGFRDLEGTGVAVLYPQDGVSEIQRLQMTTARGNNVAAAAIRGDFDDAQSAVKAVFADREFAAELDGRGLFLTSANSINAGRLLPQIAYYVYACAELRRRGALQPGKAVDFCVPTGNFGNILAAYYAGRMGAPVGTLYCASNENNVLAEFFETGIYERNRALRRTISPSMDILVSSNLERLLFELSGRDGGAVENWMRQLRAEGCYVVGADVKREMDARFCAGWCTDGAARGRIRTLWEERRYLADPHTAVAFEVLAQKRRDSRPVVVVSTASAYKFAGDVLTALGKDSPESGTAALELLARETGQPIPAPLAALKTLPQRHTDIVDAEGVEKWLVERFAASNTDDNIR